MLLNKISTLLIQQSKNPTLIDLITLTDEQTTKTCLGRHPWRDQRFDLPNITVCCRPDVAGVTFSDSDSAPVSKFLNPSPGPAFLQIWDSYSCSDSGYNHRSNRNLPMFLHKKRPHRLLLLPKWKVTPDPGLFFHRFLTPYPGPKEKRRNLPKSTPAIRFRCHLCCAARRKLSFFIWKHGPPAGPPALQFVLSDHTVFLWHLISKSE